MAARRLSKTAQAAADRERIRREADPVGFLNAVMRGKPVPVLDWEGGVIDIERPTLDHRVIAARELLKKILPDLKSVDIQSETDTTMRFVFHSPIALPNSAPVTAIEVDAKQAAAEIERGTRQLIDAFARTEDEEDDET